MIDFYGKLCADKEKASCVLKAIVEMWHRKDVKEVLREYESKTKDLPGYPLEYILHAMNWILEQEDINFEGRPEKKQKELNEICEKQSITVPR